MDFALVLHPACIGFRQLSPERNPQPVDESIILGDELAQPVLDTGRPFLPRPEQALGAIQQHRAIEPQGRPEIHGHALPHLRAGVLLRNSILEVKPQPAQVNALRGVKLALTIHQAQPQIILAHGIQQHRAIEMTAAIK